MSALASTPSPVRHARADSGQQRPTLRPVESGPNRLAHVPFVLVLLGILAAGMVGLLLLNTKIQTQADQLSTLQDQAQAAQYQQAQLQAQVNELRSVTNLEKLGYALGLRPNLYPAYLDLSSGTILGSPKAVTGKELPPSYYASLKKHSTATATASATTTATTTATTSASATTTATASSSSSPNASATAPVKATNTSSPGATVAQPSANATGGH